MGPYARPMLKRSLTAAALILALASPAAAYCTTLPDGGAKDYPRGQQDLLLCQQAELSDDLRKRAALERLKAVETQLQALELQQRLQIRPLPVITLPPLR